MSHAVLQVLSNMKSNSTIVLFFLVLGPGWQLYSPLYHQCWCWGLNPGHTRHIRYHWPTPPNPDNLIFCLFIFPFVFWGVVWGFVVVVVVVLLCFEIGSCVAVYPKLALTHNPPTSASQMLELQVCIITPGLPAWSLSQPLNTVSTEFLSPFG
jgi:hypothetical protein